MSALLGTVSTGPISTKISAPKAYYAVLRHPQDRWNAKHANPGDAGKHAAPER